MKYFAYILGMLSFVVTGISGASMVMALLYPTSLKPIGILAVLSVSLILMVVAADLSSGEFLKGMYYMLTYSLLFAFSYLGMCGCFLFLLLLMHGRVYVAGIIIPALSIVAGLRLRLYVVKLNKSRNMELEIKNRHSAEKAH